ncbi:MAG: two-component sensor histidine kinase [Planctomycetes bacterium]|nr:two-component sensor histidine kinase [Planctomycetota bacterium]NOG52808.1 two-component sensor histidine kinase [Planctomycetota bacterium]
MLEGIAGLIIGLLVAGIASAGAVRYLLARQRRQLTRMQRRAADAERLAELGRMTSGLAHEIKNPLSTIGLNAQLLSEDLEDAELDDSEKSRLIRRIDSLRREVDRLGGILTDFLQFAGRIHLDTEPHDVNRIVDELADFFLPQAQQAGVRLTVLPASTPALARVDTSLLKQALLNLLINGVHALESNRDPSTPKELMLRVERPAAAGADDESSVVINVTDTGPGIDPEKAKDIFLPYYTTKASGSGLGLPTTRRIIEEHGGQIDVHTEPGRGTSFVIRLPALQNTMS